jgi:transaldolase
MSTTEVTNVNPNLRSLVEAGTSPWLDLLGRDLVEGGELARLVAEDSLRGVTSNPSIFEKSILNSSDYDDQLTELFAQDLTAQQIYEHLAIRDVQEACDVLRPVYEENHHQDGLVSLEVSADMAHDAQKSLAGARDFWKRVNRPNVMIKIPGTKEGAGAVEEAIYEGININITLLFAVEAYEAVAEAYLKGLERRLAESKSLDIASVASFFVSRIDTEGDRRLDELGGHDELKGKLAIANAKLAYQHYKAVFAGPRWEYLAGKGATPQRVLWASTSTKNPAYRDTLYVEELIGADTVNTMPEETIKDFQDHGLPAPRLEQGVEQARRLLDELAAAGVNYDDLTDTLEREGVEKFSASFDELLGALGAKQTALGA